MRESSDSAEEHTLVEESETRPLVSADAEKEPLVTEEQHGGGSDDGRQSDEKHPSKQQRERAYADDAEAGQRYTPKPRPWNQTYRWICQHLLITLGILTALLTLIGVLTALFLASLTSTPRDNTLDISNETLGFEKVLAISFEDRTKRQDALIMGASYTGFRIDFVPGVWGSEVPAQDTPSTWNADRLTLGELGCWRAHMNAVQRVVTERLSSALILEDDADWDWFLKQQLVEVARASRLVTGDGGSHAHSPYGDDWDVLWLGNCGTSMNRNATYYYVVENDISASPWDYLTKHLNRSPLPVPEWGNNNTRWMFLAGGGVCTTGYAISYNGARKLLTSMSLQSVSMSYDDMLREFCRNTLSVPGKCVTVHPPMIQTHRAAGPKFANSDIGGSQSTEWHEEYSIGLKYSTIMNVPRLMAGAETVRSQWEGVEPAEVEMDLDLGLTGVWKRRPNRLMERAREWVGGWF